jgi:RNA polymerase sigma-70 factor (sigma-E family)
VAGDLGGGFRDDFPDVLQQIGHWDVLLDRTSELFRKAAQSVPTTDHLASPHGDRPANAGPPVLEEQLTLLFRAHAGPLVRVAVLLTGDEMLAEEVVQDAFLGLQRRWQRQGPPDSPPAYLRTSVVNGCRSALRRRRLASLAGIERPLPTTSAEAAVLLQEEHAAVFDAMKDLSRRQREVLVLRFYLDLADPEIAGTLGVSRSTVSSTISRALTALGACLEGDQ